MTTVKFDITEAEQLARHLGIAFEKVAKRAVLSTAMKIVQKITTVVIPGEPRPPVDVRAYAAGWLAKPTQDGAMIQNTVPYAAVIEYGARAENIKVGRAMIDALEKWVMRKGLASGTDTPRQIAWAIAMSMKKKGIFNQGTGLRILEKALKGIETIFAQEIKREIDREL